MGPLGSRCAPVKSHKSQALGGACGCSWVLVPGAEDSSPNGLDVRFSAKRVGGCDTWKVGTEDNDQG